MMRSWKRSSFAAFLRMRSSTAGGGAMFRKLICSGICIVSLLPAYMVAENAQNGQKVLRALAATPTPVADKRLEWHKCDEGGLKSRPLLEIATGCAGAQGLVA